MDPTDASGPQDWWVICLCAEWCEVCRQWRAHFEQLAAAHPDLHFAWIDVEDEAQAMGDVDVETFPTMLIAQGEEPRFFGPIQPSAAQLSRLLAGLKGDRASAGQAQQAAALLKRLSAVLSNSNRR